MKFIFFDGVIHSTSLDQSDRQGSRLCQFLQPESVPGAPLDPMGAAARQDSAVLDAAVSARARREAAELDPP